MIGLRNVRVRVLRRGTGTSGPWDDEGAFQHLRYQMMDLFPMSPMQIAQVAGTGFDANWRAIVSHARPVILDGDRLVWNHPDRGQIVLDVSKSNPRGRKQELFLRETGAEQEDVLEDEDEDTGDSDGPW